MAGSMDLTASIAWRISEMSEKVSRMMRSAPPSASPLACSWNAAKASGRGKGAQGLQSRA